MNNLNQSVQSTLTKQSNSLEERVIPKSMQDTEFYNEYTQYFMSSQLQNSILHEMQTPAKTLSPNEIIEGLVRGLYYCAMPGVSWSKQNFNSGIHLLDSPQFYTYSISPTKTGKEYMEKCNNGVMGGMKNIPLTVQLLVMKNDTFDKVIFPIIRKVAYSPGTIESMNIKNMDLDFSIIKALKESLIIHNIPIYKLSDEETRSELMKAIGSISGASVQDLQATLTNIQLIGVRYLQRSLVREIEASFKFPYSEQVGVPDLINLVSLYREALDGACKRPVNPKITLFTNYYISKDQNQQYYLNIQEDTFERCFLKHDYKLTLSTQSFKYDTDTLTKRLRLYNLIYSGMLIANGTAIVFKEQLQSRPGGTQEKSKRYYRLVLPQRLIIPQQHK